MKKPIIVHTTRPAGRPKNTFAAADIIALEQRLRPHVKEVELDIFKRLLARNRTPMALRHLDIINRIYKAKI